MYLMFIEGELKLGKKDEFLKAWNGKILPLLQQQDGFVDEILIFEEGSQQPCGLSFWNNREQCDHYLQEVFPQAKSFVQHLMHGQPKTRRFEVEASEVFQIPLRKVA
jgi:hypothetical protein